MRTYGGVWRTMASILALGALVAGGLDLGWPAMIGSVAVLSVLGGLLGLAWADRPGDRWRAMLRNAAWFGGAGVLLVGLPSLVGAWSFLVVALGAVTAPPLVGLVVRRVRDRLPVNAPDRAERLSEQDLVRRWQRTTAQLRHPATSPATALKLVQEREILLDDLERRDPDAFAHLLVRAGWRSNGSVVE